MYLVPGPYYTLRHEIGRRVVEAVMRNDWKDACQTWCSLFELVHRLQDKAVLAEFYLNLACLHVYLDVRKVDKYFKRAWKHVCATRDGALCGIVMNKVIEYRVELLRDRGSAMQFIVDNALYLNKEWDRWARVCLSELLFQDTLETYQDHHPIPLAIHKIQQTCLSVVRDVHCSVVVSSKARDLLQQCVNLILTNTYEEPRVSQDLAVLSPTPEEQDKDLAIHVDEDERDVEEEPTPEDIPDNTPVVVREDVQEEEDVQEVIDHPVVVCDTEEQKEDEKLLEITEPIKTFTTVKELMYIISGLEESSPFVVHATMGTINMMLEDVFSPSLGLMNTLLRLCTKALRFLAKEKYEFTTSASKCAMFIAQRCLRLYHLIKQHTNRRCTKIENAITTLCHQIVQRYSDNPDLLWRAYTALESLCHVQEDWKGALRYYLKQSALKPSVTARSWGTTMLTLMVHLFYLGRYDESVNAGTLGLRIMSQCEKDEGLRTTVYKVCMGIVHRWTLSPDKRHGSNYFGMILETLEWMPDVFGRDDMALLIQVGTILGDEVRGLVFWIMKKYRAAADVWKKVAQKSMVLYISWYRAEILAGNTEISLQSIPRKRWTKDVCRHVVALSATSAVDMYRFPEWILRKENDDPIREAHSLLMGV